MKKFFIILLVIVAIVVIDEKPWRSDTDAIVTDSSEDSPTPFTGNYYPYYNYNTTSKTNTNVTTNNKTCYTCNGSKNCHVCNGKGTFACNSMYCNSGDCTSCVAGVYDHGSYVSKCLTCEGKGYCRICKGTNKYSCSICRGTGTCTQCD